MNQSLVDLVDKVTHIRMVQKLRVRKNLLNIDTAIFKIACYTQGSRERDREGVKRISIMVVGAGQGVSRMRTRRGI